MLEEQEDMTGTILRQFADIYFILSKKAESTVLKLEFNEKGRALQERALQLELQGRW